MIWFILSGWFAAGMVAGVALTLWAEKLHDSPNRQVILDSSTDNDDPRTWPEHRVEA
jgi:hypothetical protein